MIYLDNSASTYTKPKQVTTKMVYAMTKLTANPGRSGHLPSILAGMEVENVREIAKNFFNAKNVVFTQGCTDALNLAILGTAKQNTHAIITSNDHNASIRPFFELSKQKNIEISIANSSGGELKLSDILPLIKNNTHIICVNQMSNVDGEVANIQEIGEYCDKNNIIFLVDAAQSAGHIKIDMQKSYIDLLCVAGHKSLFGPQGIGLLCYSNKVKIEPIRYGSTGADSLNLFQPRNNGHEQYESGTLATVNIAGLGAGIQFVEQNFDLITSKIDDLSSYLIYELNQIAGVKVYTNIKNCFGVIGFNVKHFNSQDVAQLLFDKYKICTRAGLHCAPLKHKQLGTVEQGAVRVSICYFNTFAEIQKLVKAVKQIANKDQIGY